MWLPICDAVNDENILHCKRKAGNSHNLLLLLLKWNCDTRVIKVQKQKDNKDYGLAMATAISLCHN